MRNLFDQYDQPENRLTHALATVLAQDPSLIHVFLAWLGITTVRPRSKLVVTQQQIPAGRGPASDERSERGIPDLVIYEPEGWAVLFESKLQSRVQVGQIERHLASARRRGFVDPSLVVLTVDEQSRTDGKIIYRQWREVYMWFVQRAADSLWAGHLVDYMRIFEQKMVAEEYQIRGTITMFDGLKFDAQTPYTYLAAKRLVRLMGDQLQADPRLHALGVDPKGTRRTAITGKDADGVWDYLPLRVARQAQNFTAFPHLSISIKPDYASVGITIPHGVKAKIKPQLQSLQLAGFRQLIERIEKTLRPVIKRSVGAKPMIYALQRHYLSQRSDGEMDGNILFDLRTLVENGGDSRVKYQPEWLDAIYHILVNKRSNIQFGVSVHFSYDCPLLASPSALDLFTDTWLALAPILELAGLKPLWEK